MDPRVEGVLLRHRSVISENVLRVYSLCYWDVDENWYRENCSGTGENKNYRQGKGTYNYNIKLECAIFLE